MSHKEIFLPDLLVTHQCVLGDQIRRSHEEHIVGSFCATIPCAFFNNPLGVFRRIFHMKLVKIKGIMMKISGIRENESELQSLKTDNLPGKMHNKYDSLFHGSVNLKYSKGSYNFISVRRY